MRQTHEHRLEETWVQDPRWTGITRPYSAKDVVRLRGTVQIEHTLACLGSKRFWDMLHTEPCVKALGAMTGNQAVQQVLAGLKAIYLSGWQVAGDANLAGQMYPDQSLYPCNSVPNVVKEINNAFFAGRPDASCRRQKWHVLVCADRRRRRGRIRWQPERIRVDEIDDRGRRGRSAF